LYKKQPYFGTVKTNLNGGDPMKSTRNIIILAVAAFIVALAGFGIIFNTVRQSNSNKAASSTNATVSGQITAINETIDELEALDAELGGYIDTLEAKVAALEEDGTAAEGEITAIKTVLENLKTKDTALDGKIAALEATAATLAEKSWAEATFATLTQYEGVQTEISDIKADILSVNTLLADTAAEIEAEYTAAISSAISACESTINGSISAINTELTAIKALIQTNAEDIDKNEQLIESLVTELESLDAELGGYIDTLEAKVAALEKDGTAAEGEITAIKTVLENLKTKDAALDGKIADLETTAATLAEKSWAEATFATLTQYEGVQTEITDIKADILSVNILLADTATEIEAEYTAAISSAISACESTINGSISAINTELTAIKALIQTNAEDIDKNEQLIESLVTEIESLVTRIETLEQEKADLQTQINCLNGQHETENEIVWSADYYQATCSAICVHCEEVVKTETVNTTYSEKMAKADFVGFTDVGFVLTDGVNQSAEQLNAAVKYMLEKGERSVEVDLPAEADTEKLIAIRLALFDTAGVDNGSVELALRGVTEIPDYAETVDSCFRNGIFGYWINTTGRECVKALGSVILPDVTYIGNDAFYDAEHLSKVSAPLATAVGDNAFADTVLSEAYLPLVETVGNKAFRAAELTEISLPAAKEVHGFAFLSNSHLERVLLPNVTVIEYYAFQSCEALSELTLGNLASVDKSVHGILHGANSSENIDLTIPCAQKELSLSEGDIWLPTDNLYSGTEGYLNRSFMGYTFKSITLSHDVASYTDNGDGTHFADCTECDGYSEAHSFPAGNTCVCGVKIEVTGFYLDVSGAYFYDESIKSFIIVIAHHVTETDGAFVFTGKNLEYLNGMTDEEVEAVGIKIKASEYTDTEKETEAYINSSEYSYGYSSLSDGMWVSVQYSNDNGLTWSDPVRFEMIQTYGIEVRTTGNGTVTTSPSTSGMPGNQITVSVANEIGYKLESLTVTDGEDNPVTVENYQFVMPESEVTVSATFVVCDHSGRIDETTNLCEDCGTFLPSVSNGETTIFVSGNTELNEALVTLLDAGSTKITVTLAPGTDEDAGPDSTDTMSYAIRSALDRDSVSDGSIDLTIRGIKELRPALLAPCYFDVIGERAAVKKLKSLTLPDVTYIKEAAFNGVALERLALTSEEDVEFGYSPFGYGVYDTDIDLVLNSNKQSVVYGDEFNGYTFKSVSYACADGDVEHDLEVVPEYTWLSDYLVCYAGYGCKDCDYLEVVESVDVSQVVYQDYTDHIATFSGEEFEDQTVSLGYVQVSDVYLVYDYSGLVQWSKAVEKDEILKLKLMNDIVMPTDGITVDENGMPSASNWKAIPLYRGTIDGNGYSIIDLRVIGNGFIDDFGFGGEVKNLTLKNPVVYGGVYVGGIAGIIRNYVKVSNCHVVGGRITGDSQVGGIVGGAVQNRAVVAGCTNSASVYGNRNVAGIVGICIIENTIVACGNTGSIVSEGSYGGITASWDTGSDGVLNVYGCWTADNKLFGFTPASEDDYTISGCYYVAASEADSLDGTTALSSAEAFNAAETVAAMNAAVQAYADLITFDYGYRWEVGTEGYPVIKKVTE